MFYNYGQRLTLVEWASENDNMDLQVQGGRLSTIEKSIKENSTEANVIRWKGNRQNMILDLDGTLTGTNVRTYITPYYKYFDNLHMVFFRHKNFQTFK